MTAKEIRRIKEGDIILYGGWSYKVVEVQNDGVVTVCSWKNYAGEFTKMNFYVFRDLLSDEYTLIQ